MLKEFFPSPAGVSLLGDSLVIQPDLNQNSERIPPQLAAGYASIILLQMYPLQKYIFHSSSD